MEKSRNEGINGGKTARRARSSGLEDALPPSSSERDKTPLERVRETLRRDRESTLRIGRLHWSLAKQTAFATGVGAAAGVVGAAFQTAMNAASGFFAADYAVGFPWALLFLPAVGLAIVALYNAAGLSVDAGTDRVVASLTSEKKASLWLGPLIFLTSTLTQFCGGSAGREGAALQLGGCVGLGAGRLFRLDATALRIATLCGLSGGFAAVFGTPLAATVFALEIACVGVVYYPALLPSLIAALVGSAIPASLGLAPFHYELPDFPETSVALVGKTLLLGAFCGATCVFFCATVRRTTRSFFARFPNDYWRVAFGALCVIVATFALGTNAFNGTGIGLVEEALAGRAAPDAFFWKTILTALTLGAGFKGGEIVPVFAVGSSFGCVAASLLGVDPTLGAALGMVGVFCGATNCPLTSIALSVELFGAQNALLFGIVCGVAFATSGRVGLYRSQRALYSKTSVVEDAVGGEKI
ncbi:MAG: chloride channel protein [Thermoguttaceae bacterium]|nr:chloride channel protein [Thermoguttaceae bacterium]